MREYFFTFMFLVRSATNQLLQKLTQPLVTTSNAISRLVPWLDLNIKNLPDIQHIHGTLHCHNSSASIIDKAIMGTIFNLHATTAYHNQLDYPFTLAMPGFILCIIRITHSSNLRCKIPSTTNTITDTIRC